LPGYELNVVEKYFQGKLKEHLENDSSHDFIPLLHIFMEMRNTMAARGRACGKTELCRRGFLLVAIFLPIHRLFPWALKSGTWT